MIAGVVAIPAVVSHADHRLPVPECKQTDPRFQLLRQFLHRINSPVEHLTPVFIQEADRNRLDWRLLPSLSFVESGVGREARGNNVFGWNNGATSFRSVREGIQVVANRLAHGKSYRGKSTAQKLNTYNQDENYGPKVMAVMARISHQPRPKQTGK